MKPLEFKIEYIPQVLDYCIVFYYEDGATKVVRLVNDYNSDLIEDIGLDKQTPNKSYHYSIADIYGYKVKDDREGL